MLRRLAAAASIVDFPEANSLSLSRFVFAPSFQQ
jgi:hypothetical protein